MNGSKDEGEFIDAYVDVISRRKFLILCFFAFICFVSFVAALRMKSTYITVSLLRLGYLQDPILDSVEIDGILQSNEFNARLVKALPFSCSNTALKSSFSVDVPSRQGYLHFTVRYPDAEKAIRINKEASRILTEIGNEKYNSQIIVITQHLKELEEMLASIDKRFEVVSKITDSAVGKQDVSVDFFVIANNLINSRVAMLKDKTDAQFTVAKSSPGKVVRSAESAAKIEILPRSYILGLTIVFGLFGSVLAAFFVDGLQRALMRKRKNLGRKHSA